jgi:hypothetical protein
MPASGRPPWTHQPVFRRFGLVAAALMTGVEAARARPQAPPARELGTVTARLAEPFTSVRGVRELRDGRLLVLDHGERTVHLVDFRTGTRTTVGRHGRGPDEYLLPSRILALRGDSTAILDNANRRLLVIGPDGRPGGLLDPYSAPGSPAARPMPPAASDATGRFLTIAQPVAISPGGAATLTNSAAIERWTPGANRRDTVAFVRVGSQVGAAVVEGSIVAPAGSPRPFEPATAHAFAPDGRLAVVHPIPYRVEFIGPDGAGRLGPSIPHQPLRLTSAHKDEWREARQRPVPVIMYSAATGQASVGLRVPPQREPARWPEFLPPFPAGAARFDLRGILWVERTTPAGQPPLYDLIGRDGTVIGQVRLPPRARVAGFGTASVYLVVRDENDLEYLARHPLPTPPPNPLD